MKVLFIVAVCLFGGAFATYNKLKETCRSAEGNGYCISNEFCCRAAGGTVVGIDGLLGRSVGDEKKRGCSYNGVCCVVKEPEVYDCDVCGLKGNGDLDKAEPIDIEFTTTTTTTERPVKKIVEKVVGGYDAERNEWCWQVALINSSGIIGGGALIGTNWVVTAGHKVAGRFLDEFIVVLGEYDFQHDDSNDGEDNQVYYATPLNVHLHPGFNPQTLENNIALIKIPDAPCSKSDGVCTVCLPRQTITFPETEVVTTTTTTLPPIVTDEPPTTTTYAYGGSSFGGFGGPSFIVKDALKFINRAQDTMRNMMQEPVPEAMQINVFEDYSCFVTGWGQTGMNRNAQRLQEKQVGIITDDQCRQKLSAINVQDLSDIQFGNTEFCVLDQEQQGASCYGDGGGPLVCQNRFNHAWELQGIMSKGANMCMDGVENGPSIMQDVGFHYTWILDTIEKSGSSLPDTPTPQDGRKAYKVEECGSNTGCKQPTPSEVGEPCVFGDQCLATNPNTYCAYGTCQQMDNNNM